MDYLIYKEHKLPAILAITQEEQAKGLMFKTELPPVMAFTYTEPRELKFWMKNVPVGLDIVFCLKNKISFICKGKAHSTELIGSNSLSDLVLEMPLGNSDKLGMKIGDKISMEYHPSSLSKILLSNSLNY